MTAKVIFRPDNFADRSVNRDNYLVDRFGLIKIYVDGACIRNGKSGAQAGFAVWFNDNHPRYVFLKILPFFGSPKFDRVFMIF